jgi:hypothetical protein
MGRPYKSELLRLAKTFSWSSSLDTKPLADRLSAAKQYPLLAIGSGGSQSTAHLISDRHQRRFGQLSKADTPLIARSYLHDYKSFAIVLVSAGGRNPDILGIAREAIESEPKSLIAICSSLNSPLSSIVNSFSRGFCFEFDLPGGRDGFLATNSLLALSTVALTAYGYCPHNLSLHRFFTSRRAKTSLEFPLQTKRSFIKCKYLVVLYGAESRLAAIDLESKLIEAGLVSVQLSDYRNFAHGRHHWIAKNPDTAVLALAAGEEILLASRTLELLPPTIPKRLVKTEYSAPASWLALQAAVFALVAEYGKARHIDPGRPGVPSFGRRVYHFNAFRKSSECHERAAVRRKLKAGSYVDPRLTDELNAAFARFTGRFRNAKFQGIVLDYDGTICDVAERFGPIPDITANALRRITEAGFLIGVATGRGKSVRKALQSAFPKSHWERIWVGYYNGGVIARLDDDTQPDINAVGAPQLRIAAEALKNLRVPALELTVRPQQITVESNTTSDISQLWCDVLRHLQDSRVEGLKVMTSTRSVDVVPMTSTKLALVQAISRVQPGSTLLCIGDRPRWPGNDTELLTHEFSLSVDEVDGDPMGAWNLAPAGLLGSAALRYYLSLIAFRSRHFRLRMGPK